MIYFLYTIHIVVSIFLVLVVLLQQGKGADLSVFGGGSTQAAFGARGATTLLHKLTVGGFVLFTLTTLSISLSRSSDDTDSVMRGLAGEAGVEEAVEPEGTPLPPADGDAGVVPEAEGDADLTLDGEVGEAEAGAAEAPEAAQTNGSDDPPPDPPPSR